MMDPDKSMPKTGSAKPMRWRSTPFARALQLAAMAGIMQLILLEAVAQMSGPGAGRGFLIDKHSAAAVRCAQCHTNGLSKAPETSDCLGCHGGSYAKLAAKIESEPNPHRSHLGELPCDSCHKVHAASSNKCTQCHMFDMRTP